MSGFHLHQSAKTARRLSKRQQQVLIGIALGNTHKAIAGELGISEGTVENHVTRMYKMMGINCIAHATRAAVKAGLIDTI
jgi:DNA-binding NarL/FixJ family response regulator